MLINCQSDAAKKAPNTSRHIFTCKNLENNKLKTWTEILHVLNWKAYSQITYKLCISINIAIYIELENF